MSTWNLFITAFVVGLSGALMPGPLLTIDIEESIRRGGWTGPKLIAGHGLLELALILAIMAGFGRLLDLGAVKGAISLIGGAVLLWLAQGMIREALAGLQLSGGGKSRRRGMPLALAGAVISLSNPYWSLWWATVGLTYLTRARELGFFGAAVFFGGHILADFSWYSAVSLAMAQGRRVFSDRVYRGIVLACGLFLVYVGLWFMDSAFGFLGSIKPSEWIRTLTRG